MVRRQDERKKLFKGQQTSKGQYLVIEEMMIFLMGMLIVLGSIATFRTFGSDLEARSSVKEMNLVGEKIANLAVKLTKSGTQSSVRSSVYFETPRKITGKTYTIYLKDNEGINIKLAKGSGEVTVPLRGLEDSINLEGNVSSVVSKPKLIYSAESSTLKLGW